MNSKKTWYDIIEEKEVHIENLPQILTLGRYILQGKELIPNKNNRIYINDEQSFNCSSPFIIEKRHGAKMLDILSESEDGKEWDNITPLNASAGEEAKLTPLEKHLIDYIKYVQEICHKPHLKLITEIQRMPVSRAKRIPFKAVRYLAAHSEDWAHRSFQSVIPKHILSEIKDEEIDIYENRLVASLIHTVDVYLKNRIKTLKEISSFLEKINKIISGMTEDKGIIFRKVYRNNELAAQAYAKGVEGKPKEAAETLEKLNHIHQIIKKLKGTDLFKKCKFQKNKIPRIHPTNLLSNDKNYRFIRIIWISYIKNKGKEKTEEELINQNKNILSGYSKYCELLLQRAINDLKKNKSIYPTNSLPEISIKIMENTIKVQLGNEIINCICLPDELSYEEKIKIQKAKKETTFLFIYEDLPFFGLEEYNENYDWYRLTPKENELNIIPISCENIDNIERVQRYLLYFIIKEHFSSYPINILNKEFYKINKKEIKSIFTENTRVKLNKDSILLYDSLEPSFFEKIEKIKLSKCKDISYKLKKQEEEKWNQQISLLKGYSEKLKNWKLKNDRFTYELNGNNNFKFEIEVDSNTYEIGMKKNQPYIHPPNFKKLYQETEPIQMLDTMFGMNFC